MISVKRPENLSPTEASFCRRKVLGNCPPTLPLRQNLALIEKSVFILARGRGSWAVSQKRVVIRRNHVGKINGNEGFKRRPHRQPLQAFGFLFSHLQESLRWREVQNYPCNSQYQHRRFWFVSDTERHFTS